MTQQRIKILAINPGCHYFAIAAFNGPDLFDWRIKSLEGDFHTKRLPAAVAFVASYLDRLTPAAIAIKTVPSSRSSANLKTLLARLWMVAGHRRIPAKLYGIRDLEAHFEPKARINKQRLAELVAATYPVLASALDRERRIRNRYHGRMFEAVAAGALLLHQLEQSHTYANHHNQDSRH